MSAYLHPNALALKQITAKVLITLLLTLFVISNSLANRNYGPVKAKDYLIKIVNKSYRDSTLTKNQIMVAILRSNPEAFRGGNIHFLKQAVTLNLPDESDIATIPAAEASALVAEHLTFFKQGKTGNFVNKALLPTSAVDSNPPAEPDEHSSVEPSSTATATPSPTIPTKIKIEVRNQKQQQENKIKHVESLEKISTQQNKTLHSLDEQIRVLEDQLKQDHDNKNQATSTDQTTSAEPAIEPTETKSEDDETAENAISSLTSILAERQDEPKQQEEETGAVTKTEETSPVTTSNTTETVQEAPIHPTPIQKTPINKTTEKEVSDTSVDSQDSSVTEPPKPTLFGSFENPKQIGLLSAFILGLFALGYFFLGRGRTSQQQTVPAAVSFDTAPTKTTTDTVTKIPNQDNLLNPVIKKQPSSKHTDSSASTENSGDDAEIKINMARAYMDMGYIDAAKESLEEVLKEGTAEQKDTVQQMLSML